MFQHATTDMSLTKRDMLSAVHTIFRGLQQHLKDALKALPDDAAPEIKCGLTDAHCKLSDYYTYFDASPYYLWLARKLLSLSILCSIRPC